MDLDRRCGRTRPTLHPSRGWLLPLFAVAFCATARAEGDSANGAFVQFGKAGSTDMAVVGWTRDWRWREAVGSGLLTGLWEVSFGRWSSEGPDGDRHAAWVTQLGVTPVLRWYAPNAGTRWLLEAGIGANLLTPIYRRDDKQFSTTFNFGDHIAVGWRLDVRDRHELALRLQHFSNAGIKHPNPGENFLQVRYTTRY